MRACAQGHPNVDHARFCTTCGQSVSPPVGPSAPSPVPPPPPGGGRRRDPAIVVGIVLLVAAAFALVSVVAAVTLIDDDDESALGSRFETVGRAIGPSSSTEGGGGSGAIALLEEAGGGPAGSAPSLVVLRDGAPLVDGVVLGWGSGVPIWAVPERSTYVSPPDEYSEAWERTLVPIGDDEVVAAWSDGVDTVVSQASLLTGQVDELFRAEGRVKVFHDAEDEWILVVSDTDRGKACSAGRVGSPIREVVRASGCAFSPSGRLLAWDATDLAGDVPTYDVEAFEVDGTRLSSFTSTGPPLINRSGRRVQVGDGRGFAIVDPATGEQLATTGDVEGLEPLGWLRGGSLVYLRTTEPGLVTLEELGPEESGARGEPLASGDALRAEIVGDRSHIVVGARRGDTFAIERIEVSGLGERPLAIELYAGAEVEYRVFNDADDMEDPTKPHIVAWTPGGGSVWSGSVRGLSLAEVGTVPEVAAGAPMAFDPESDTVYLMAHGDGPDTGLGLYAVGDEVQRLTKGWDSVEVVDVSDGVALVLADGGRTGTLALAAPGEWTVLDEAHGMSRPMVVDGVASWSTWDSGVDRRTVRSARLRGREEAATTYEDAGIAGRAVAPELLVLTGEQEPRMREADGICHRSDRPDITERSGTLDLGVGRDHCVGNALVPGTWQVQVTAAVPVGLQLRDSSTGEVLAESGPATTATLEAALDGRTYELRIEATDDLPDGTVDIESSFRPG